MSTTFGKVNLPVSFNPQTAFPLDSRAYFESLSLAQAAATSAQEAGSAASTYYFGQIVSVYDGTNVSVYKITKDEEGVGTLVQIDKAIAAGDLPIAGLNALGAVQVTSTSALSIGNNGEIDLSAATKTTLSGKQDALAISENYNAESSKIASMADITSAVAGLSGAMHFEGVKESVPTDVTGYESGDVIIVGNKEYVFDGTEFKEIGDETIYAVKGSIVNADIASDAAIEQSKISGLTDALASKVSNTDFNTFKGTVESDYLTKADASSTYLTTSDAGTTYATKAELGTTDSNVTALTTRVAANESAITALQTKKTSFNASSGTDIVVAEGVATWEVTHELGSQMVAVAVFEVVSGVPEQVIVDVKLTSENVVTLSWNATEAPAVDAYKVFICK